MPDADGHESPAHGHGRVVLDSFGGDSVAKHLPDDLTHAMRRFDGSSVLDLPAELQNLKGAYIGEATRAKLGQDMLVQTEADCFSIKGF